MGKDVVANEKTTVSSMLFADRFFNKGLNGINIVYAARQVKGEFQFKFR